MHEASLAEGLLKLTCDSVDGYNATHPEAPVRRVSSLTLGLGLLSCVEIETFSGCFELLAEGTIAEGARLDISIEPLPCECRSCGAKFTLEKRRFQCPSCGAGQLSFTGGHGLTLLSLETER